MTAVQLKLGPADHGHPVAADDFEMADYEPGYKYEIIDGRLCVSPAPNLPEHFLEMWLRDKLLDHARSRPGFTARITTKSRVFVPDRPELTVPEPDIGYYDPFPTDIPTRDLSWDQVSPLLVAEVLVDGNPDKDLVRNVELYFLVPSIAEYWVLDGRDNPDEPLLVARRRHRGRWLLHEVPFGEAYTTPTLPGFELPIDPHR